MNANELSLFDNDPRNKINEECPEEFSPERKEDGSYNAARQRALDRNARRIYEDS